MYGGQCHHAYFRSALELHGSLVANDIRHDFYTLWNESAVHRARNQCVKAFLNTDFEYMLFVDGDIEFTCDDVALLSNLDTDIAAGCYRMKQDNAPFAAWCNGKLVTLDDVAHCGQPFKVDYAGTGFMLIKRHVIERLCQDAETYDGPEGLTHQLFRFPIRNGVELSEDYAFCEDARNAGFNVVMHPRVRLVHWGIKAY